MEKVVPFLMYLTLHRPIFWFSINLLLLFGINYLFNDDAGYLRPEFIPIGFIMGSSPCIVQQICIKLADLWGYEVNGGTGATYNGRETFFGGIVGLFMYAHFCIGVTIPIGLALSCLGIFGLLTRSIGVTLL